MWSGGCCSVDQSWLSPEAVVGVGVVVLVGEGGGAVPTQIVGAVGKYVRPIKETQIFLAPTWHCSRHRHLSRRHPQSDGRTAYSSLLLFCCFCFLFFFKYTVRHYTCMHEWKRAPAAQFRECISNRKVEVPRRAEQSTQPKSRGECT